MTEQHVHRDGERPEEKAARLAGNAPTYVREELAEPEKHEKGEHEKLGDAFRAALLARFGRDNFAQIREQRAREQREQTERERLHAEDAATAERERLAAIEATKQLAPGIPIPAELPTVSYDPVSGTLVKIAGGPAEAAEQLVGTKIER